MSDRSTSMGATRRQAGTGPLEDPDVLAGSRPLHRSPGPLAFVFAGATLGTAAREALNLAFPPVNGVSWAILVINAGGAFLLGMLLEVLDFRGPDRGRRRVLRLLFGTGLLGGFTTYSALAADSANLIGGNGAGAGVGIAYAAATVLAGGLATWAGIAAGAASRRSDRSTPGP